MQLNTSQCLHARLGVSQQNLTKDASLRLWKIVINSAPVSKASETIHLYCFLVWFPHFTFKSKRWIILLVFFKEIVIVLEISRGFIHSSSWDNLLFLTLLDLSFYKKLTECNSARSLSLAQHSVCWHPRWTWKCSEKYIFAAIMTCIKSLKWNRAKVAELSLPPSGESGEGKGVPQFSCLYINALGIWDSIQFHISVLDLNQIRGEAVDPN